MTKTSLVDNSVGAPRLFKNFGTSQQKSISGSHFMEAHSNKKKRGLRSRAKTLIKKGFLDVTRKSYRKLKVFGIGFKVSCLEFKTVKLLKLELGYSHSVYYRIPDDILVFVSSPTKFILSGVSSDRVAAVASQIRKLKLPEFYKGKGILYESEEVVLKEIRK